MLISIYVLDVLPLALKPGRIRTHTVISQLDVMTYRYLRQVVLLNVSLENISLPVAPIIV